MCQLCGMKNGLARWPKAVEEMKPGLELLVENAHEEHEAWQKLRKQGKSTSTTPESLLEVCRLLSTMFDSIDEERDKWWTSPAKRTQRQRFEHEGKQQQITDLQKINNAVNGDVENMRARLGLYVRWNLGMSGGLESL